MTIETKTRERFEVPFEGLAQVELSAGRSRKRSILIGVAVPLALGLAATLASSDGMGQFASAMLTAVAVPTGAIIGALCPTERWTTLPPETLTAPRTGVTAAAARGGGVNVAWTVRF